MRNTLYLMDPDGANKRPVHMGATDLSEIEVGFSDIGHWIDNP